MNFQKMTFLTLTLCIAIIFSISGLANLSYAQDDSDGDSIPDADDFCPYQFGQMSAGGCPDADFDSVADNVDLCPHVWADPANNNQGCPFGVAPSTVDSDGDTVPDSDDVCPGEYGIAEWAGCPDADNDGLTTQYDSCPTQYGPRENNGCPAGSSSASTATCRISFTGNTTYTGPSTSATIQNAAAQPGTYNATARTSDNQWWLLNGTDWVQGVPLDDACYSLLVRSGYSSSVVRPNPAGNCASNDGRYLPARLIIGQQGRSIPNNYTQALRSEPDVSSSQLISIADSGVFAVVGGPRCGQNPKNPDEFIVWWQVTYLGYTRWTGESDGEDYWAEPWTEAMQNFATATASASSTSSTSSSGTTGTQPQTTGSASLPQTRIPLNTTNLLQIEEIVALTYDKFPTMFVSNTDILAASGTSYVYFSNLASTSLNPTAQFALLPGNEFLGLSPDGQYFAVGDFTGAVAMVRLYTVNNQQNVNQWAVPAAARVVFSPDSRLMVTLTSPVTEGIQNDVLNILSVDGTIQDRTLQIQGRAMEAVFSADSQTLALNISYGQNQSRLSLINMANLSVTQSVETAGKTIGYFEGGGMAFSPDGSQLLIGTNNGQIEVYDTSTLSVVQTLWVTNEGTVRTLAFNATGTLLAASGGVRRQSGTEAQPGSITLFDASTYTQLAVIAGSNDAILNVAFNPGGVFLLLSSDDQTVKVFAVSP